MLKRNLKIAGIFLISLFCSTSCKKSLPPQVVFCMDTVCTINCYDEGTEKLYKEITNNLLNLESQFSITKEDSFVSQVNNNAGIQPCRVSEDVISVLELSEIVSQISKGAFDVSANPIISLWGITSDNPRVPSGDEILDACKNVGYDRIKYAHDGISWILLENGMSINFGAVAKGYAADSVVQILEEKKVHSAIIDLGGNIYCYGTKNDNSLWTVGIKNPQNPTAMPLLKVRINQGSVVTSGDYERFFEEDGKRYHHIMDPHTGAPVENELSSVTVICESSTIADALSTTFFVAGQEKAFSLLEEYKKVFKTDIGLVLITKNGKIEASENLKGRLDFYSGDLGYELVFHGSSEK